MFQGKKDEKPTATKNKLSSVCLFTGDKNFNAVRPFNYKSSSMDIAFGEFLVILI